MQETCLSGLDRILYSDYRLPAGRCALLSNSSASAVNCQYSWEIISGQAELVKIFSPEHGLMGAAPAGQKIADDSWNGIPVISLYGEKRAPAPAELEDVDALIVDLQDTGLRYFTYIYSMAYSMEAAAKAGCQTIVSDRPNLLGGQTVEGGAITPGCESFVGKYGLPQQYGLSIGELALYFRDRLNLNLNPEIIQMKNWSRNCTGPGNGRCYSPPSPNLPSMDHLQAYRATHLIEGTNLSEGRGTASVFLQFGAPWLKSGAVTDELNKRNLPGVTFRAVAFIPSASKFASVLCQGVYLHIVDESLYSPLYTGLSVLEVIRRLHPDDFSWIEPFKPGRRRFIEYLCGSVIESIERPAGLVAAEWEEYANHFRLQRKEYFLYD